MAQHLDLEEQEQLDQLKHFWATWGTLITAVLTVVLVALAAWNGYQFWQARQAAQASALSDAIEAAVASKDLQRLEQAFGDMRKQHSGTTQASQAALMVAQVQAQAGKLDAAKEALAWLVAEGSDEGYKSVARLRLASVLMEQGAHEEALAQLGSGIAPEFAAVAADRKGDALQLLGKRDEAVAQYTIAYQNMDSAADYRRLVEVKLNALGVRPDAANPGKAKDLAK
jgi:predicted negative regulator of RcsB-dependent stress response